MRVLTLILTLSLIGCMGTKTENRYITVTQKPAPIDCGPEPQHLETPVLDVDPKAVTDADGITWVGLSPAHYENLGTIVEGVKQSLVTKNEVIKFYRDCILDYNKALADSKVEVETPNN